MTQAITFSSRVRLINFFGGPSSGKSTLSSELFPKLKRRGVRVEAIQEKAKEWMYQGKKIDKWDQIYLLATQVFRETSALNGGCDLVTTDSPTWISAMYGYANKLPYIEELIGINRKLDWDYPVINFFVDRGDKEYSNLGRTQNYEEAVVLDGVIKNTLAALGLSYFVVGHDDVDGVIKILENYGIIPQKKGS